MAQNGFTDYSGETINGYQVEKIVLHHLVSTRYLAKNKKAEPVYLEILNVASDKDAEMDGRFQERMKLLQQRNFTGVAPVLDVGHTTQDHAYAVIQYAPGLTLARQLADWREKGSRLPIQSALSLVQKIAVILGEVYADDLYHADLCPENIVLGDDDELVLYGLGIPYQPQPSQPIKQVQMLDYLSPEQWQGRAISDRSNIYSLGVILYELLVGHRPEIPQSSWDIFERTTLPKETPLEEARSGLSEETYSLVKTCLWRQEWSRYETVSELIEAIVSAQQAEVLWQQRRQSAFQIPRWLYFAAPALLFLIVLAIMLSSRRSGDGGVATAVPTINTAVNQTQEATPVTIEPPTPIPTDQPIPADQIVLLAPTDGFQFSQEDTIIFDWVWSEPLKDNQRFVVKQVTGDEVVLGIVDRPVSGLQYRLTVDALAAGLKPGVYQWAVILETTSGEEIKRSDLWNFVIQAGNIELSPTATETSQSPAGATETSTPATCVVDPPASWVVYTVKQGDFLFNLAIATGTTVENLQAVNCLTETGLGVGQRLWLPVLPPTATPTPAPTNTPSPETDGGGSGGGGSQPKPTKTAPPPPPQ